MAGFGGEAYRRCASLAHSGTAVVLLAILLAGACGEDVESARRRAEAIVTRRQIEGLKQLVAGAESGELSTSDQIAIGIEEEIVRDILTASLPLERPVSDRFKIRLERAEVRFGDTQSVVILRGQAGLVGQSEVVVSVLLAGSLDQLHLEEGSGRLKAHIALQYFEVEKVAAGGDRPVLRRLIDALGRESLSAFQDVVPEIEIPVKLDPSIRIKGLGRGPVAAQPGELPLHFEVARVVPLNHRLWVLLNASVGSWRSAPDVGQDPPEPVGPGEEPAS